MCKGKDEKNCYREFDEDFFFGYTFPCYVYDNMHLFSPFFIIHRKLLSDVWYVIRTERKNPLER